MPTTTPADFIGQTKQTSDRAIQLGSQLIQMTVAFNLHLLTLARDITAHSFQQMDPFLSLRTTPRTTLADVVAE